jgi:DNA-binding transcriptional MerR regulator
MTTTLLGIHDLEKATGVPMRTLRHWARKRLLPKPIGRGRVARYTDSHLLRALAIKHLRLSKLSLNAIYKRIAPLNDEQLRALLPPPARATTADGVPAPPPEPTYPFAHWELVELMRGLFLMVDPRQGPVVRRIVDDIYRHYSVTKT